MSMSKKDYEAVASVLRVQVDRHSKMAKSYVGDDVEARRGRAEHFTAVKAVRQVAVDLASHFAGENERFDRVKFLTAAGVQ